jgi:hypothetical protein
VHDEDGDWQFLPETEDINNEVPKIVGLGEMVSFDPSLRVLLTLGWNQVAVRETIHSDWVISSR